MPALAALGFWVVHDPGARRAPVNLAAGAAVVRSPAVGGGYSPPSRRGEKGAGHAPGSVNGLSSLKKQVLMAGFLEGF